jgi:elongation factor P
MMIDVNMLRKGTTFTLDGERFKVRDDQHHKPGRGKANIRTTVRNLRTGAVLQKTFISGDRVEDIRVEGRIVQYLYNDGEFCHFMDVETYEQPMLPTTLLGDDLLYLKEGLEIKLLQYEGETIDYELPTTVDMKVVQSEMAVAGDTATGATKELVLETGLKVRAPLFVETGDVIRVDTRTGEYVSRA